MRITVIATGKLKERYWRDACDEYLKRLQPYAHVTVTEISDRDPATSGGEAGERAHEGEDILHAIPTGAYTVLLAIEGTQRSSEGLSKHLDDLALHGTSDIAFVIGGSCGVSPEVMARADETLSFGLITLPHNIARIVLLEQLYRSFRISRGEPYHK